jgi:hypothetical protein
MDESASLKMLKKANGGKAPDLKQELEKVMPADEEVTVDVDTMNGDQLDALVKENEIETPIEWTSWDAKGKRQWLKEQFSEDGAANTAETGEATASAAGTGPSVQQVAKAETAKAAEPDAEKPKAKSKGKGKKKGEVIEAAKVGEIMEPDVLQDMVHEIENLKEEKAHKLISELMDETEVTFFRLGGILSIVQANGWYAPYASFREFIEQKHGLSYRKAIYWIEIYNRLSNSGIPWVKVKDVGWTKLQIIASVLTLENVDEWVTVAGAQNTLTLTEAVKNAKAKAAGSSGAIEDQTAKTVTTMTFKVHGDQKAVIDAAIEKAKTASGTAVSTAALEFIAQDFLGGQTLVQRAKAVGADAWLKAAEQAFPGLNIEVTMVDEGGDETGDATDDKAA